MNMFKSAFLAIGMCCASVLLGQGAVCYGTQRSVDLVSNSEQLKKYWEGEVAFQEVIDYAETIGFIALRDEGHVVLIEEMALPITRVEIILEILTKIVSSESGAINADQLSERELLLIEELSAVSDGVREELRDGDVMIGFTANINVLVESDQETFTFETRMRMYDRNVEIGTGSGVQITEERPKYSPHWNLLFREVVPALDPITSYRIYRRTIDKYIEEKEAEINNRLNSLEAPFVALFDRMAEKINHPSSSAFGPASPIPDSVVQLLSNKQPRTASAHWLSDERRQEVLSTGRIVGAGASVDLTFVQRSFTSESGHSIGRATSTYIKGLTIPLRLGG